MNTNDFLNDNIDTFKENEIGNIYCLVAKYDNYNGKKFINMNKNEAQVCIKEIVNGFKKLPIPPNLISMNNYEAMFVEWCFPEEKLLLGSSKDINIIKENFEKYMKQIPFAEGSCFNRRPCTEEKKKNPYLLTFGIQNQIVPVDTKIEEIPDVSIKTEIWISIGVEFKICE